MTIDVFFCTLNAADKDDLRSDMARLCFDRWQKEPWTRLHVITPQDLECSNRDFQRRRRIYADSHADSSVYVVADDDCLLGAVSPVGPLRLLMEKHWDFQILSLFPSNANIVPWTPENYSAVMSDEVWEHVSVGNIRFCRKGVVEDWPIQTSKGYDTAQCDQIRGEGKRVGYAVQHKMTHLGEGYSSIWP